jgi:hypothetical protein
MVNILSGSFEEPQRELFLQFARHGLLTIKAALDLKEAAMSDFQAFSVRGGTMSVVRFRLDRDWLAQLRAEL